MHTPEYPFYGYNPLCHYIQTKVVELIDSSIYDFELPFLTRDIWQSIIDNDEEKERLEFVGDALIGSCVAQELLRLLPHGTPGFYTCIRKVLVANSTFAHLMRKAGFHRPDDDVKRSGDAFEVMIACYHAAHGQTVLEDYVKKYFDPLIACASVAYERYRGTAPYDGRPVSHTAPTLAPATTHGGGVSASLSRPVEASSNGRSSTVVGLPTRNGNSLAASGSSASSNFPVTASTSRISTGSTNYTSTSNSKQSSYPTPSYNANRAVGNLPTMDDNSSNITIVPPREATLEGLKREPASTFPPRETTGMPSQCADRQIWASFGTADNPIVID
ncbi:hypothetical protein D9613_001734 [Agrocybe pediades]|uniref:RNase III domain-containing protein n=1 Tax=Agrocybe pediades TaxID=84607 RepID=A0A8H4R5D0_9AGAR|nr:hypothetical protein D9613_001734 [Agrocybe pediades]KAF9568468.1 hypothetical protein CPC08DRAFT_746293 [Agrocybe pediades]